MALKNLFSNIRVTQTPIRNSEMTVLSKATSTDTFAAGDLVDGPVNTGTCDVMDAADQELFIGVSNTTSLADGTTDKISVYLYGVIEGTLAIGQTTSYFGEGNVWVTGDNGTNWTFGNTAVNAITHTLCESIAAGSSGSMIYDPYSARVVTALSFWELPSNA